MSSPKKKQYKKNRTYQGNYAHGFINGVSLLFPRDWKECYEVSPKWFYSRDNRTGEHIFEPLRYEYEKQNELKLYVIGANDLTGKRMQLLKTWENNYKGICVVYKKKSNKGHRTGRRGIPFSRETNIQHLHEIEHLGSGSYREIEKMISAWRKEYGWEDRFMHVGILLKFTERAKVYELFRDLELNDSELTLLCKRGRVKRRKKERATRDRWYKNTEQQIVQNGNEQT